MLTKAVCQFRPVTVMMQRARALQLHDQATSRAHGRRLLSTTTDKPTTTTTTSSGASLWQRLVSFSIGAGLSALVSQYYLFVQVRKGNKEMLEKQKEIEVRLAKLERKK